MCVPACARMRWLVQREESRHRPRLEARVYCPGARPCGPLRRQPAVACRGMRDDRRPISPSLRQPVVPRRASQDPLRLHPTRSCAACPGSSVPCCALWRATAAGGVPKMVRTPYARDRRPAQPLRWLPRVTRAGGGALVSGRVAHSTVAVRHWCELNVSQCVVQKYWGRRCASPRWCRAYLVDIGESQRWLLASMPPNFALRHTASN